ncbi:hypothetical protein Poli38472_008539 [Pythium oligandrum]|uniref:Uncharacterized protein n=1 Tax=Pythium oligandrum TaxID=41045 RepID=A0A8K1FB98_PYTOL|nr:hypothetical protein Poli38472_008539 [Pythium oligandrum]|eukprot:TMW55891.1 hypothetical protein Poli38472_008539 [Pythium oligandrum]
MTMGRMVVAKRFVHGEAAAKWQTWRCMQQRMPGFQMSQMLPERRVSLGAVPLRTSNTLYLRGKHTEIPFTGFELIFLGTSAGSPSVRRNPTGLCLRLDKSNWMFDCAEGSLRQLMKSTIRVPSTDKFFITHLHGDHLYGLPGILCTLDNHNAAFVETRTKKPAPRPISVYGPLGLFSYLNTAFATSSTRLSNLTVTVHELVSPEMLDKASNFEKYMSKAPVHPRLRREVIHAESDGNGLIWKVFEDENHRVLASTLKHTVTSFGYVVEERELPGKLKPELLIKRGLRPGPQYRLLKQGKGVTLEDGTIIQAHEVTGPPVRGRKVVILGDTADSSRMFDIGRNCDVLVHEATLGHEMLQQAVFRGHSTARMAGYTARRMNATLLALTHFSHRFRHWAPNQSFGTTQHLTLEAQLTFGRRAVMPASDFLRIPIPRHPHD